MRRLGVLLLLAWWLWAYGQAQAGYPVPGTTGHVAFVPQRLPHVAVQRYRDVGPPLVFSDNPEVVFGPGLLARASVAGAFRIMGYHSNAVATPMIFAWLVKNPGSRTVTVAVYRMALAQGRTTDANLVGQEAAWQFFRGTAQRRFSLPPGAAAWIFPAEIRHPVALGHVQVDMADVVASERVVVAEAAMTRPSLAEALRLPPERYAASQGDGAGRGLFPHSERVVYLSLRGPRAVFWVASGRPDDPYVTGVDPLTGDRARDVGNYGVTYRVVVTVRGGATPERAGLFLSTGSPSQEIEDDTLSDAMWVPRVGAVRVPADNYFSITNPHDVVFVESRSVPPRGRATLTFDLVPPAGCNAMVNVLLLVHPVR